MTSSWMISGTRFKRTSRNMSSRSSLMLALKGWKHSNPRATWLVRTYSTVTSTLPCRGNLTTKTWCRTDCSAITDDVIMCSPCSHPHNTSPMQVRVLTFATFLNKTFTPLHTNKENAPRLCGLAVSLRASMKGINYDYTKIYHHYHITKHRLHRSHSKGPGIAGWLPSWGLPISSPLFPYFFNLLSLFFNRLTP